MTRLRRFIPLLQQLAIALLLVLCAAMLGKLWLSGDAETTAALAGGKRFVVTIEDGKVEGLASKQDEAAESPAIAAALPPAPVAEPKAVEITASIQPSSSPISGINEELLDKSAGAPLPKISASGIKPWQYYAKSFRRQNEMPMIAIVVTGLGHSKKTTELALSLDDRIGLSFSPYAVSVASWAAASRMTGHEMYVDLPLQTARYPTDDPGPFSILTTRSNTDNVKNLLWAMSRFQGYVGLYAPMDEVVTPNHDTFVPLAEEIARRGLLLLMGRGTVTHEEKDKRREGLLSIGGDVWIDEELSEMNIQARLATLEQTAQRNGMAIGVAGATPLSIAQIRRWHETLGERGIVLAPVTFITKLKHP